MNIERQSFGAGTKILFAAPAKPMAKAMTDALSQAVAQVEGILEAHVPLVSIPGEENPRQKLVIGVQRASDIPQIAEKLMGKLNLLPPDQAIEMIPFEASLMPSIVRSVNCKIYERVKRSWWKVW